MWKIKDTAWNMGYDVKNVRIKLGILAMMWK
jgi:hypothetical protein